MSREQKLWFSADEISKLGLSLIAGLPKSNRGATRRAKNSGWASRVVSGKGGKGGVKTEYQPPQEILSIIHSFLNEHPDFFTKGKAEQPTKEPVKQLVARDEKLNYRRFDDYQPGSFADFILVPEYDVRASAGGGSLNQSEQIVGHLAFKKRWVTTVLCCNPKDLVLITVKGDSMEPTLSSNDLILVNTSRNQITDNAVYVLQHDGALLVKRIQRKMNGVVLIKSDNPEYENEELDASQAQLLHVLGIVEWYGRRM